MESLDGSGWSFSESLCYPRVTNLNIHVVDRQPCLSDSAKRKRVGQYWLPYCITNSGVPKEEFSAMHGFAEDRCIVETDSIQHTAETGTPAGSDQPSVTGTDSHAARSRPYGRPLPRRTNQVLYHAITLIKVPLLGC